MQVRRHGGGVGTTGSFLVLAFTMLTCVSPGYGSEFIFAAKSGAKSNLRSELDIASRFYGLSVRHVAVDTESDVHRVVQALKGKDALGLIVMSDVVPKLEHAPIFAALRRSGKTELPLLIVLSPEGPSTMPASWFGNLVKGCTAPERDSENWSLRITEHNGIARQLAGIDMPFKGKVTCGLDLVLNAETRVLAWISSPEQRLALFADAIIDRQPVFFLGGLAAVDSAVSSGEGKLTAAFSRFASLLMFLRHVAGEQAWHRPSNYANLTIDDAWLIQPYGNLDYAALLEHMEEHNFHTTVAFTAWNFDRSKPDVVSLFRTHPKRFSIAVHGNNHDHQEFAPSKPNATQIFNLKQALARMEEFRRQTGLPYDPVMVFPQAVAGTDIFRLLKAYNYWATVNAQNVPADSVPPSDLLFSLRPDTLHFANFPSLHRYSVETSSPSATAIAIHSFLGNPLLLYGHQGFFQKGIGAFDEIADLVNGIDPNTKWEGVGHIAQHLYLLRQRTDQDYDVLARSSNFYVTNPTQRSAVFHVRKPEDFNPALPSLTVDGQPISFEWLKDEITFDLRLAPGESKHVELRYANDLDLSQIGLSKNDLRVNLLRTISDFRDLFLSRSSLGRAVTDFYYRQQLNLLEEAAERKVLVLVCLTLLAASVGFIYRHSRLRRKSAKPNVPSLT